MDGRRVKPSALERYCASVVEGHEVACVKVRKVCQRLLNDIANPGEWRFDRKRADRAVEFVERFCKIPSGKIGQPFVLEPYEKAWTQALFGFVDGDGKRRFREAFIVVGRKNGKTSLVAAWELYVLIADGEFAPQICNVANSESQARLAYNAVLRMRNQSRDLQQVVRPRAGDLYCQANMGYIKPMASNPKALDGLDVHMGVLDEMGAMRDRDLYDLTKQAMAAREQPLLVAITTNGFVRNCIFDDQYAYAQKWLDGDVADDRFLAFVYELDDRGEWTDEKAWKKANPGLGTVKKLDTLRGYVRKAKADPSFRPTVMTKDFNMPENSSVAWLDFEEAVNEQTFYLSQMGFRYGVAGFDAADSIDLNCAHMLMMRPGDDRIYEKTMYWLPEDALKESVESGRRVERDGVPYQAWIARGLLRTVPGNKVDKRVFLEWLQEMRDEHDIYTYACGFDPWHMDDSTLRELEEFVGKERAMKVRQGAQTLSDPMKQIKADYRANRIVDNHNPINEWCRMNVSVKADVNGNIQPDKKMNNPANRIDGFAAEIDAYIALNRVMDDYLNVI